MNPRYFYGRRMRRVRRRGSGHSPMNESFGLNPQIQKGSAENENFHSLVINNKHIDIKNVYGWLGFFMYGDYLSMCTF